MTRCIQLMGLEIRANRPFEAMAHLPVPLGGAPVVDLVLDQLPPHAGTRDEARTRLPYVSTLERDDGELELFATRLPGGDLRLDYDDGTVVVIDALGRRVWSLWPDSVPQERAAVYLLGPVVGVLLRLRGVVCLHASAVQIGDEAVAIVGRSEAGKSSTAAAFAMLGHRVLCDDIVPIFDQQSRFGVIASPARIRLWPDSAHALFGHAHALPRLAEGWDKRVLDLTAETDLPAQPVPLAAIYVLAPRNASATDIGAMTAVDALTAILSDTFAANYLDAAGRAAEFDVACRILGHVPLRRVSPLASLGGLSAVAQSISADFATLREERGAASAVTG